MKFEAFFDKLAWIAITAIGIYAASNLKEMNTAIALLNTSNAVFIEKMSTQEKNIEDHSQRLKILESKRH